MNFLELQQSGFDKTEAGLKKFNTLLAKEYKKSLDSIRGDLQVLYNKITGDLSPAEIALAMKSNPAWYYTQALKFDRLQALQKKVQTEFIKASIAAGNMTVESSKMAITNNFYSQQFALDFAYPKALSFTVLNPKVVEVSVLGTPEAWNKISKKIYGKPAAYIPKYGTLSSILTKNRKADLIKIQSAITQGLIQGHSYTKTAGAVKDVLGSTTSQAITILRTEGARNMNSGAYASHNIGVSKGVPVRRMAVETLDTRTRQQSQSIDGDYADENDQFHYPGGLLVDIIGNSGVAKYDINERGRSVEIIEGEEPTERRGRDPVTGKNSVMSYKNYDTWAEENGLTKNATGRWVLK